MTAERLAGARPDRPARPPRRGVWGSLPGKHRGPNVAPCEPPQRRHRHPADRTFDELTRQSFQNVNVHNSKPLPPEISRSKRAARLKEIRRGAELSHQ
jgi:hypothetical protein